MTPEFQGLSQTYRIQNIRLFFKYGLQLSYYASVPKMLG